MTAEVKEAKLADKLAALSAPCLGSFEVGWKVALLVGGMASALDFL